MGTLVYFGNVPHPWALPIAKHEATIMVNQTYVDHKAYGWEGSYTYSSIVGGFLRLLLNSERVLTSISRHNFSPLRRRHKIPPNFKEGNSCI